MANWFIGVRVPAGAWFGALPKIPKGFERFHPTDLHVTVAFLGEVGQAKAEAAWAARVPVGPIEATLGPVQPFGGRGDTYTALSSELAADALVHLLASQRNALRAAAGVEPEYRRPRPHATLTRPRWHAPAAELAAGLAWAGSFTVDGTPVLLDRLALFTRSLDPAQGLFRAVHEAPL